MQRIKYDDAFQVSVTYFKNDTMAADNFLGKYALRDDEDNLLEDSPVMMHRRLAREFARIEAKYPNPLSEQEIFDHLSVWDIVAQGSPMSGIGNKYQLQSLSNCFVIESPHDSYGGILHTDQEQAQIMKRRGGVGFDISTIRPKNMRTRNAAKTTDGIGVFMDRFSRTCREVAQGGRRGALMLTISCHHPEIETFIDIKRDKDKTSITGANISIRWTDEFMNAVKLGKKVQLRFPVEKDKTPIFEKWVDARSIWDRAMLAAWEGAEPGALFWDTATKMTPADAYSDVGFGSKSTNPCISGDTLIAVADGRNAVSIRKLAEEKNDVPVYSTNIKTGQVEIKWGRNPRLTKQSVEVWKLTLDDETFLIATPDHKILLRNLTYVNLQDLQKGDSVFPFSSFDSNSYRQICNAGVEMTGGARRNRRQYRLIHEFLNGAVDSKVFAIHHRDFDSSNDKIENLEVMTHGEHRQLHTQLMMGEKNPYHRMTDEWKFNFAKHVGKENGRFSGYSNEQLLDEGRSLFVKHGKITCKLWQQHAKENGFPQHLSNNFRFGSWKNFVNQVANNHKVVSVEKIGIEDVFNITVDDNHNYHVITSNDEKAIVSSGICVKNCGEIILSPSDSCRLMLVNIWNFVLDPFTEQASFQFERFSNVVQVAQRLMDDLIDLEIEMVNSIIEKVKQDPEPEAVKKIELDLWTKIKAAAENGRRTGLGVTGLGDAIAGLGVKYGSLESIKITEDIYKTLAISAYKSSCVMAGERGTFKVFDRSKEENHPFLQRIFQASPEVYELWKQHGRRNISLTTTAPTGTVSTLTQTTGGIEPAIYISYKRRKKISNNDLHLSVDFVDSMGDKWHEYTVYHHKFLDWMRITGKTDEKESPYWNATSENVDWMASVKLQAAAQRWICHAISKTCNLPKDVSIDLVKDVYMAAWENGCKGFTIYRAGSRDGVLIKDGNNNDAELIVENHAPKRPKDLQCEIHRINVRGKDDDGKSVQATYLVLVGLMNDKPYEIFCGLSEHVEVPKKYKKAVITKNGKKNGVATYNLRIPVGDEDEAIVFKDIVNSFDNPIHGAFTRTLSLALRHGIPLQYIVDQLQKDKHSDMQSFSRVIARVLKQYVADGTQASEKVCDNCGAENSLVYIEHCLTCKNCENSKCG